MELLVDNFPPGTATLIEELDKKLMVLLRDGRTLIGYLRSIDQFANLVLHRTIERIHVGKEYGDISRGVFIIRGENVALLGEIVPFNIHSTLLGQVPVPLLKIISVYEDEEKESDLSLTEVSVDEILDAQRREQETKQARMKQLVKAMKDPKVQYGADLIQDDLF